VLCTWIRGIKSERLMREGSIAAGGCRLEEACGSVGEVMRGWRVWGILTCGLLLQDSAFWPPNMGESRGKMERETLKGLRRNTRKRGIFKE